MSLRLQRTFLSHILAVDIRPDLLRIISDDLVNLMFVHELFVNSRALSSFQRVNLLILVCHLSLIALL